MISMESPRIKLQLPESQLFFLEGKFYMCNNADFSFRKSACAPIPMNQRGNCSLCVLGENRPKLFFTVTRVARKGWINVYVKIYGKMRGVSRKSIIFAKKF